MPRKLYDSKSSVSQPSVRVADKLFSLRHSYSYSGPGPAPARDGFGLGGASIERKSTLSVAFGRSRSESPLSVRRSGELGGSAEGTPHSRGKQGSKRPASAGARKKAVGVNYDIISNNTSGSTRMRQRGLGLSTPGCSHPEYGTPPSLASSSRKVSPGLSTITAGTGMTGTSKGSRKKKKKATKASRRQQEMYADQLAAPNPTTPSRLVTPRKAKNSSQSPSFASPATLQLEQELGKAVKMLTKHIDVVSVQLNRAFTVITESASLNDTIQKQIMEASTSTPQQARVEPWPSPSPAPRTTPPKRATPPSSNNRYSNSSNSPSTSFDEIVAQNGHAAVVISNHDKDKAPATPAAVFLSEAAAQEAKNDVLLNQLIQNSLYAKISAIYHSV